MSEDGMSESAPAIGDPREAMGNEVLRALSSIYDPEIPVNIYDLGLIYGVEIDEEANVAVKMTLTSPHCPEAQSLPGVVERKCASVPGVKSARVEIVWEPPWEPSKMSESAKLQLNMM